MAINCGIVGLPNVGKSTLFNALTQAGIESANFPFCTIEPNTGVVPVPDQRLDCLAAIVKPQKVLPTTVEFVDIAGLVAGASKGEGLGNKFLANIRETDAILHVVRCFDDNNIVHVDGRVDPLSDIETINIELALADLDTLEKAIIRTTKKTRAGDKEAMKHLAVLELIREPLENGRPVRSVELSDDQRASLKTLHFLTAKPTLYIANVDEVSDHENAHLRAVLEYAAQEGASVVPICAKIEEEIVELDEDERAVFLEDLGMDEPGLHRVIRASYTLLGLHTYFTAGEKEVRAWQIPVGASAPQAAAVIHTDFEKGFIRAEVIAYTDYVELGGEGPAKEAGKWRLEGKDYIVHDGDVVHFRFNV